jgi:N utilization substance protein A
MAVYSEDNDIDAIGACVGQRGIRVERVVDELHGEKIDIVNYSDDPVEFIANALSPAKVVMIYLYEDEKVASVVVPDNQLSLAIGRQGQNARLAAKLTGWKIDIKSQSQIMEEEMNKEDNEDSSDEDDELMQSSDEMTDDGEDLEDEFDLDFDDIDDLEGISEEEEDI